MKIVYLAQIGLFDDWAHTVQIMKMCEAFAEKGAEVELVVPNRKNPRKLDPFEYNNTKRIFKITKLPYIDLFFGNPSPIFYWIRFISFLISARIYLIFSGYDLVYTRELYMVPFFRHVFIERHSLPKTIKDSYISFLSKARGVIVLTSFIKSKLERHGVDEAKILIAPDGVKIEDFSQIVSTDEAKEKLRLPKNNFIGYVGTLKTMGMEKGVSTAILALHSLPQKYKLYVVGGESYDVDFYKKFAGETKLMDRVIFTGRVLSKDVPLHISACDILVAPFPKNDHYSYYMSPLKIFEYMASHRPIIATDLPSLREVLEDRVTAILISPDDPEELAKAVLELEKDQGLSSRIATNAYNKVTESYTWLIRAGNILKFILR